MVLEKLGDSLKNTLAKVKNSFKIDKDLVEEVIKEIQKSLLGADVNVRLVLELTKKIRERALVEHSEKLTAKERLISIIYEELVNFLGEDQEFEIKEKQNRILLVGLYGQGKTTTTGKLGLYFKKRGKKVAVISTDTWRPAAAEQLQQLSKQVKVDCFINPKEKDPCKLYKSFSKKLEEYDVVIIDSAGRDSLNQELVDEISDLNSVVKPTDTFLVLGADVGQTAQKQAEMFKEKLEISGVVITKLDGTGKGGGALSACAFVDAPVRFIGVGEKPEDLERFNAKRFVSTLLGMGDLEALLEKAKLVVDENQAKEIQEKLMSGEFDLDDLYEQLKSMNKMGSFSKILNMIPGMGNLNINKDELKVQEEKLERWKYLMDSMTKKEKKDPDLLDISRLKRVAKGSGGSIGEIRDLLKHYKQTKKMMGLFKNPQDLENMDMEKIQNPQEMMKMMKKMGGNKLLKQAMKKQIKK